MKIITSVSTLKDWSRYILSLAYMIYSFNALITAQSHRNRAAHPFLRLLLYQEYRYLPRLRRTVVQVLSEISTYKFLQMK